MCFADFGFALGFPGTRVGGDGVILQKFFLKVFAPEGPTAAQGDVGLIATGGAAGGLPGEEFFVGAMAGGSIGEGTSLSEGRGEVEGGRTFGAVPEVPVAGVAEIFEAGDGGHFGADGIEVDVVAELAEGGAGLDEEGFVAALEEVTALITEAIETIGEGGLKPLHAGNKVAFGGFEREVEMVAHEDVGMEAPAGFAAGFPEAGREGGAGGGGGEDISAVITAIDDVVNGAGVFEAKFAGHSAKKR